MADATTSTPTPTPAPAAATTQNGATQETKPAAPKRAAFKPKNRIMDEDDEDEDGMEAEKTTPKKVLPPAPKPTPPPEAAPAPSPAASASKKRKREDDEGDRDEKKRIKTEDGKHVAVKEEKEKASTAATAATAKVKKEAAKPSPKRGKKKAESESESESEEESDEESSDDEPKKKRKSAKKAAPKKKATPKKKKKKEDESEDESDNESEEEEKPKRAKRTAKRTSTPRKKKKDDDEDGDDEEEDTGAFKWWENEEERKKHPNWKWKTLAHAGVVFPPAYEPHGVKMKYDGKPVELTNEQEEAASFFARYLETDHYKKPQFKTNFFKDFLKLLNPKGSTAKHIIQDFAKCDFSPIAAYLKEQTEKRKARSKDEKKAEKEEKDKTKAKYGFATVNGNKEPIGNFTIEPPGLFLGRGDHPKSGCIKKRITPEDVTINLDEDAAVPPCPITGHKWGGVVHNHEVGWIASWNENINDHNKYVLFGAASSIRGQSDRKKFETARRLKGCIGDIRESYEAELKSKDTRTKQRATAMWVIDHLALRVGNEKGEDEADTVGCCSLRVEHVKLLPDHQVQFDFLGKDSMPYKNTVSVDPLVYANFKEFLSDKKKDADIFDHLTTSALNKHLQSLMKGLTAKVFRTYNASITLQQELAKLKLSSLEKLNAAERLLEFNRANRQVAILCNHQKTVSKNFGDQMAKLDKQIADIEEQKTELKDHLKVLNGEKKGKKEKEEKKENSKKRKRDDDEEDEEEAPEKKKQKLSDDPDKVKKRIKELDARIAKIELKKTEKDDLKTVALGTSKINYIDPRITIAWCTKVGLDLKKVFSKTLRDKFTWAISEVEADKNWSF